MRTKHSCVALMILRMVSHRIMKHILLPFKHHSSLLCDLACLSLIILQVPPVKYMIFVCDCILELMNAALTKQDRFSSEGLSQEGQGPSAPGTAQESKFDKWVDSPRARDKYLSGRLLSKLHDLDVIPPCVHGIAP